MISTIDVEQLHSFFETVFNTIPEDIVDTRIDRKKFKDYAKGVIDEVIQEFLPLWENETRRYALEGGDIKKILAAKKQFIFDTWKFRMNLIIDSILSGRSAAEVSVHREAFKKVMADYVLSFQLLFAKEHKEVMVSRERRLGKEGIFTGVVADNTNTY